MNRISHDSIISDLTLTSIAIKTKPKPSLYRVPEDLIYTAGDYFIYSFPTDTFSFDNKATKPYYKLSMSQTLDPSLPSYLSFNPLNLTLQGTLPATIQYTTILRFDLTFNGYASHNLKLIIQPRLLVYKLKYQVIATLSVIAGTLLYFGYLLHFIVLTPAFR